MKRMRTSAVVAAGVVASAILVGTPVAAQDDGWYLMVSPLSGPGGTVVNVDGTGCFGSDVSVHFWDWADWETDLASATAVPNPDGSWHATVTVPAGLDPTDSFGVDAGCWTDDEPEFYDPMMFDLTDAATPPTTVPPTVPPTTPPTTAPVTPPTTVKPSPAKPSTPAPTPAKPIVKEPGTLG